MVNSYHNHIKPWITVDIETVGDSKFVTIRSSIHVNKEFKLPHSYGLSWGDWEILRDSSFLKHARRFY